MEDNGQLEPAAEEQKSLSGLQKIVSLLKTAVVEPFFILFMFSYTTRSVSFQELVQNKVCLINLGYNTTVCEHLNDDYRGTAVQLEVQSLTTNITMGHTIMTMIPSIIAVTLLGSYCDKYGRKIPIIVASIGILVEIAGIFLCIVDTTSRAGLLLLTSIPSAFTGGIVVAMTLAMSYLGEVTEPEDRSLRFALMEMSFVLAAPAGGAFGGYLRKKTNHFHAVFIASFVSLLLALIWIAYRMEEPNKMKSGSLKESAKELFSFKNVLENLRTSTKKRAGNARKQIWFLYLAICLNILTLLGIMNIGFMYVQLRYSWDNFKYSMLNSFVSVLQGIVLAVSIGVLTKVMKVHDCVIIVIGCSCNAANYLLRAFADVPWLYLLGCVLGLPSGITSIGIRTRLSSLVDKQEIGKIFSVMTMCESLTPIVGSAVWTQIYNASAGVFPGLAYFISAFISLVPIAIGIWILKFHPETPKGNSEFKELTEFAELPAVDESNV